MTSTDQDQGWDRYTLGMGVETERRTITEFDLRSYVLAMGLFEPLFTDETYVQEAGYRVGLVPALLTVGIAEGLIVRTGLLQGTALALLSIDVSIKSPTYVGDTVVVKSIVTAARPTKSDPLRGVVETTNTVSAQDGRLLLTYKPTRLLRASPITPDRETTQ